MKLLIATPAARSSRSGNRTTANRYSTIFHELGHQVTTIDSRKRQDVPAGHDLLIALHAGHSSQLVEQFRKQFPSRPVVVVVTGTDVNRDLLTGPDRQRQRVLRSFGVATRIVVLQSGALKRLSAAQRKKSVVIHQSVEPLKSSPQPRKGVFEIVVSGHLRAIKDPFRTAMAARLLPAESKIVVTQIGNALTEGMRRRATKLDATVARYHYVGQVSHSKAMQIVARSRLLISSSKQEGGPAVVGEAIANGVPVLASRIDAHVGLLGPDYPGLFPVGDTKKLSELMLSAEMNAIFLKRLVRACRHRRHQFAPDVERRTWKKLLANLAD